MRAAQKKTAPETAPVQTKRFPVILTAKITEAEKAKLDAAAAKIDRPLSYVIRDLINKHL